MEKDQRPCAHQKCLRRQVTKCIKTSPLNTCDNPIHLRQRADTAISLPNKLT